MIVAGPGERLIGQTPTPAAAQPTIRVPLFRQRDAILGLGIAALTAITMSVDESIARNLQRASVQTNGGLKGTANVFNTIGFPGSPVLSASTYFIGLAKHSRPIASLGMHTGEAIVMGGVLAEGLQMTIGRARPQRDVSDSEDFVFGKGFSNEDFTSFPSAHTTVAFAAATAVTREVGRSWPGASKYVTPISYSVATLVGLSRMYKNKHWASDVVGSAGLGIYSAVLFDRYNAAHPDNIFERIFLPKSIVPRRGGVAFLWSATVN
jgi:membrane-associated phospholipid phosphatase